MQQLSDRVLDFEIGRSLVRDSLEAIVSLIKTLYPLLSTGLTYEDRTLSRHDWKTVNWGIKHKRICDEVWECVTETLKSELGRLYHRGQKFHLSARNYE